MAAGKPQYEVRIGFHECDQKTGKETRFNIGDLYTGSNAEAHLAGHDSQGPLIVEKYTASDSGKEN